MKCYTWPSSPPPRSRFGPLMRCPWTWSRFLRVAPAFPRASAGCHSPPLPFTGSRCRESPRVPTPAQAAGCSPLSQGRHHRYLFSRTGSRFERAAANPSCFIYLSPYLSIRSSIVTRASDACGDSFREGTLGVRQGPQSGLSFGGPSPLRGGATGPGPFEDTPRRGKESLAHGRHDVL